MIAVIFEVWPGDTEGYLERAAQLRTELSPRFIATMALVSGAMRPRRIHATVTQI